MRKLNKPNIEVGEVLDACINHYIDESIKSKIQYSRDVICNASNIYNLVSENRNWQSICEGLKPANLTKKEMIDLYDGKFVACKAIRKKYYDKIMSLAEDGICPICCVGAVKTLDHYLPKSKFPMFSITPNNLVPSCRDCNSKKNNKFDNNYSLIHPYYDDIDDFIWLSASLKILNNRLIARYSVSKNDVLIDDYTYKRICYSFNEYELDKLYELKACEAITNQKVLWKNIYFSKGKRNLLNYFKLQLGSVTINQNNSWMAALYRGLIDSIDLFDQIDYTNGY